MRAKRKTWRHFTRCPATLPKHRFLESFANLEFSCYRPASQDLQNTTASSKPESSAQSNDMHRVLLPNQSGNQCKPSATKSDIGQPAGNSEADCDKTVQPETTNPDPTETNAEMTMKQDAADQPSGSVSDADKLQGDNKER